MQTLEIVCAVCAVIAFFIGFLGIVGYLVLTIVEALREEFGQRGEQSAESGAGAEPENEDEWEEI